MEEESVHGVHLCLLFYSKRFNSNIKALVNKATITINAALLHFYPDSDFSI